MSDDLFELGERIAGLAARINIATFDMLTLVAEFDRREGWADDFASCAEWLAWRTGRTLAAARENVRVAHALEELPLTAEVMKSGRLSYTKVRTMTRVATPETEATLLEYAQSTSAARLERLVRGWKTLSRDGELAAEEVRHRSRTFSVAVDADGMYVVRGRLEPEVGAVLMRAIEAAGDALYRGEDGDARPRNRQRRADAAGLVAERALAAGFGGEGASGGGQGGGVQGDGAREGAGCGGVGSGSRTERYQVVVHTEAATLMERGGTGRSELGGVRVSAETSRRMACDAARVAMGHRDGQVVSVGRRTRTIPPHIRRALEERDRGCRHPGCASRFTEAHHVKHWADGARRAWPTRSCSAAAITAWSTRAGRGWRWTVTARRRSSRARVRCWGARPRCRRSPGSCRIPRPRPPTASPTALPASSIRRSRCRWSSRRWRRWRDRAPTRRRGKTRDTSMSERDRPPAVFVPPWFDGAPSM